jgi:hypothetical protein
MRVSYVSVFLLTLLAGVSMAQVPSGNIFVGYSYLNADTNTPSRANLNGWEGSVEGKVLPFLGLVGDFSGHYGTEQSNQFIQVGRGGTGAVSVDGKLHSLLFGPRVSVSVHGVRPFGHVLVGGAWLTQSIGSNSVNDVSFATAVGGGVDFKLVKIAGWRVQGDLLHTQVFGNTQNNVRISTGLVFHF